MAKRLFDIVVSLAALLLLALPMLAVAAWIKLDSPGPVFFRQQRVGRHGVPFAIHKFRTMRHGAGGLALTVGDDARITRAGRWLRRTRLDELPQLLDVLAGDMSLVGPRPEVPRYVALYPPGLRDRALAVRGSPIRPRWPISTKPPCWPPRPTPSASTSSASCRPSCRPPRPTPSAPRWPATLRCWRERRARCWARPGPGHDADP
jgi:hypothetical protein